MIKRSVVQRGPRRGLGPGKSTPRYHPLPTIIRVTLDTISHKRPLMGYDALMAKAYKALSVLRR